MMPKAIKDGLKAVRYGREGVRNYNGDLIVDDLNWFQIGIQALGFTPDEVAYQYQKNRAVKNIEQRIIKRRKKLLNRYAIARRNKDTDFMTTVKGEIAAFNKKNYKFRIKRSHLNASMKRRRKLSRQSDHGIYINKKLRNTVKKRVRY